MISGETDLFLLAPLNGTNLLSYVVIYEYFSHIAGLNFVNYATTANRSYGRIMIVSI